MIKIAINYEYEVPEKDEAYNKSKIEIISSLMKEKEEMKSYLLKKQEEINNAIDFLIKGTNITEAENFIREVSSETKDEGFRYIGEQRQEKINNIYLSYREIQKGVKTFLMLQENNVFEGEEEKILLIKSELTSDINNLNNLLKKEAKSSLNISLDSLFEDRDFYEKDICNVIRNLKMVGHFKIVK